MPGNSGPGATGTLALVPANGGTPRALAGEFASARYGVWSPDGKQIVFVGPDYLGNPPNLVLRWRHELVPFDFGHISRAYPNFLRHFAQANLVDLPRAAN